VKKPSNIAPSEDFERALARCAPEDFDGHTEFHRLTPEQRLDWLSQVATFIYEHKGRAHDATAARGRDDNNQP
jgi:hypothetical protein